MISGSRIVKASEENMRLDVLLANTGGYSRSKWQKEIKEGRVMVDGLKTKPNYSVSKGQEVVWSFPKDNLEVKPLKMDIEVVFEDEYLAAINKPRGISVHPGNGKNEPTLAHGLLARFNRLSDLNGDYRRGIVHRLDKDTSGLMIIAKENDVHENLAKQFKARTVYREYLAVVKGCLYNEKIIKKPISRHKSKRTIMDINSEGKEAISIVKPLLNMKNSTLVSVEIKTGRTHQIRVHLKSIGHPVIGDDKYGGKEKGVRTVLLSAVKLGIKHPVARKEMLFELEPPKDILAYINKNNNG